MKSIVPRLLNQLGVGVTSAKNLALLKSSREELNYLRDFIRFQKDLSNSNFSLEMAKRANDLFSFSSAQLHQDLMALIFSRFKVNGFFVEFGATDGLTLSNTYLLENKFDWDGILAEPGKKWHASLLKNRKSIIETRCVWKKSGEKLEFNETEDGELSTLTMFSSTDMHAHSRLFGHRYFVDTISLEDLLDKNNAPRFIDYLSIDTEGSEFEILSHFNFDEYQFGFITCEHNFTQSRDKVFKLLTANGYRRVLENMSLFDDWYIHGSLIESE